MRDGPGSDYNFPFNSQCANRTEGSAPACIGAIAGDASVSGDCWGRDPHYLSLLRTAFMRCDAMGGRCIHGWVRVRGSSPSHPIRADGHSAGNGAYHTGSALQTSS